MGWLPKYEGEGIAACIPTAFLPWAPIDILVKLPLAVCLSTWRRKVELSNSRGQRGSLPQIRRGLTLLSQLCRDPAVWVRNREESWGSCLPSRWGPLPLHQTQMSRERPLPTPQYPCSAKQCWLEHLTTNKKCPPSLSGRGTSGNHEICIFSSTCLTNSLWGFAWAMISLGHRCSKSKMTGWDLMVLRQHIRAIHGLWSQTEMEANLKSTTY